MHLEHGSWELTKSSVRTIKALTNYRKSSEADIIRNTAGLQFLGKLSPSIKVADALPLNLCCSLQRLKSKIMNLAVLVSVLLGELFLRTFQSTLGTMWCDLPLQAVPPVFSDWQIAYALLGSIHTTKAVVPTIVETPCMNPIWGYTAMQSSIL